jgi:type VI secretion system protein ImpM
VEVTPPSSRSAPLAVGAFGKLPKVADFVRVGLQNEVSRGFEEWLHQGVQYAHDKRGNAWKSTFQSGKSYASVFRVPLASGGVGLLGALVSPSHDSVGRAFPLATYVMLPADAAPSLVPQALGTFLDQAATTVGRASELTAADLTTALQSIGTFEDLAEIAPIYEAWTQRTRLTDLWRTIFETDDPSFPAYGLYLLSELVRPLRAQALSTTPLAFRVPLGRSGMTAASFWLDVVRCALKWSSTTPTFFWTFDGYSGDLLIQLGRTPVSSFMELWWPDPRNDAMTTLIGARPWGDSLSRLPPSVARCFGRPHATVAELLRALWT